MRTRFGSVAVAGALSLCCWFGAAAYQAHPPRIPTLQELLDHDNNPVPMPTDGDEKTEWTFARLKYPSIRTKWGEPNDQDWYIDAPRADRQFLSGVRRLTRVHARSLEEIVNLDDDKVYNWPWIYAVEVGHWDLTDAQCAKLRDYLLRGGFLMTDDFHGTVEWATFTDSMSRVFPDRPIIDIQNQDAIFHVLYDLDERFQVPGAQHWLPGHHIWEKDGYEPKWRAIYDDKGRIMVAICHNMDLGDAWEYADYPAYPMRYTSLAYRTGINYVIYAMTH